jgi:predicted metal-dependent enzyme (double-stranded beta helix superfamily)
MFDLDEFIADCVAARREPDAILAVKEVLDRALRSADQIAQALPATGAEFAPLYTSDDLTILKFVWGPSMSIPPHDHLMWAVNGIYGGEEDNVFFRRTPEGIVEAGGRRVGAAESAMLGADVIHAVTNPSGRACTGSIHIYGGDFMRKPRSMWDAETHEERAADGETVRAIFEEARSKSDA